MNTWHDLKDLLAHPLICSIILPPIATVAKNFQRQRVIFIWILVSRPLMMRVCLS